MDKTINIIEVQIKEYVEMIHLSKEIRDKVDIGYQFQKNTLELFEIRPKWDKNDVKIKSSFAKTRFIKTQGIWKIY